jgi:hypothetical protein
MRKLPVLLGVMVSISAMAADTYTVRGELIVDASNVRGRVLECGTNRVIYLGAMASIQYFNYSTQRDEISEGGKFGVLVEVSGELRKVSSSSRELMLNQPRMLSMTRGSCKDAAPDKPHE